MNFYLLLLVFLALFAISSAADADIGGIFSGVSGLLGSIGGLAGAAGQTATFAELVRKHQESHGCSKNVWLGMDRASKCPQLNGAVVPQILAMNATTIVETPVQPRLFGRRGVYNANCEWMVIVVKRKGCILLDTDNIEFECQDNTIFYKGHEVSSYVCALSVFPDFEMVM